MAAYLLSYGVTPRRTMAHLRMIDSGKPGAQMLYVHIVHAYRIYTWTTLVCPASILLRKVCN